jgi:hypothetical protein
MLYAKSVYSSVFCRTPVLVLRFLFENIVFVPFQKFASLRLRGHTCMHPYGTASAKVGTNIVGLSLGRSISHVLSTRSVSCE